MHYYFYKQIEKADKVSLRIKYLKEVSKFFSFYKSNNFDFIYILILSQIFWIFCWQEKYQIRKYPLFQGPEIYMQNHMLKFNAISKYIKILCLSGILFLVALPKLKYQNGWASEYI